MNHMKEGNIANMNKLKVKYYTLCERTLEQNKKIIEKEIIKVEKDIQKEIKDAEKGIRSTLRFDVENIVLVPERYKMIDEKKINEYKRDHKDEILKAIKDNTSHELIPGIKFRIERNNVTY